MRGTKYTEAIHAALVNRLANGITIEDACDLEGIGTTTHGSWMETKSGYRADIKKALKKVKELQLKTVLSAGKKSWQASAWYLERRHPEEFGRRDRMDLTSKGKEIKGVIYMPVKKEAGVSSKGGEKS